jgi:hypothetical protein
MRICVCFAINFATVNMCPQHINNMDREVCKVADREFWNCMYSKQEYTFSLSSHSQYQADYRNKTCTGKWDTI